MNDNLLLQRPRLGRTLERGYTMPINATFGKPNYKIDGGTGNDGRVGKAQIKKKSKNFVKKGKFLIANSLFQRKR